MVATIKDIAKATGVSTATVSRVINHLGGYSKEVELKVLQIAKELGYRKNENAISLVKNTTKTIGVIMPDVATSFYGNIVNGIEDKAYDNGYSVILTHAGVEGKRLQESLNLMAERRVDGLIIFSLNLSVQDISTIDSLDIPLLLLSTKAENTKIPYIKVDDYSASYAAVQYLIKNGHTKIGLAGVNPGDPIAGKPRIQGYLTALEDHHIQADLNLIKQGDFSFESGKAAMTELIEQNQAITAVFCVSDETALGVLSVCYTRGFNVPNDISVVGYDNSSVSQMSIPPLTTIAQPFYDMGSIGCESLLIAIATGKKIDSQIIPFKLIERNSVTAML
ncbi:MULTISPECIES: substrate-binding domain-containing protein [unclassified Enterococcus]|uniref:LacI family DNA-binding transcriptional regulator n=1 Tax=unclassified Enterococcus TaxID=2608891 RepID=UPI001557EF58|nr:MULTISPECIES: substrate-binding domain-containing protein [unclassified Enterococcus]MBS7577949.1 substrate-binding domain-containing protein [Enterococcus sp. MMGLQ5-2]MBS7585190.1 substrate-binding domain-containing protein [Enterococcus sp. MMGLQ5-1]NPD13047.1 substrate-binding domain-containing protein [Enterococcus sp. MMGLQ5-1]NPD37779.1 substrate-binding domain-containing protein [Enterococcus sp. MMGLQ5-2]